MIDGEDLVEAVRGDPALAGHQPGVVDEHADAAQHAQAAGKCAHLLHGGEIGDLKPRRCPRSGQLRSRRRTAATVAPDRFGCTPADPA